MNDLPDIATKRFSVTGDIFIALCTFALFYSYLKEPEENLTSLALFAGFGSFMYYAFLHSFDHRQQRYKLSLVWYAGLVVSLAWFIVLNRSFHLLDWHHILAASILFIYQIPYKKLQVRDIPYLKSVLISFFWCYFLVWLPLDLQQISVPTKFVLVTENFIFILSLCLVYDYYDLRQDEKYGLVTLVNFRFKYVAQYIIHALLVLACVPGLLVYCIPDRFGFHQLAEYSFIAQLAVSILSIGMWKYRLRIPVKYLFVWDGIILLKAILILLLFYQFR